MSDPQVGDSIKALAACDRLPEGTIVGFAHPIYQGPSAAVRVALHDGTLLWATTGYGKPQKTRTIKQAFGWAPFVILHLPDCAPLNTEARIGYRTYGHAPVPA